MRVQKKVPKICKKFQNRKRAIKEKNIGDMKNAENQLSDEQHELGILKIKKNMSILRKATNSQKNIWDVKKMFFPKIKSPVPVAKRNIAGQIITNSKELKKVYLEHFVFRMRKRPIYEKKYRNGVSTNFTNDQKHFYP